MKRKNRPYRYNTDWSKRELRLGPKIILYLLALFILLFIITKQTHRIREEIFMRNIWDMDAFENYISKTVDSSKENLNDQSKYLSFREFMVIDEYLVKGKQVLDEIKSNDRRWEKIPYMNELGYFTLFMMVNDFLPDENPYYPDSKFMMRFMSNLPKDTSFHKIYGYYDMILGKELQIFPIPYLQNTSKDISYTNSWFGPRTYGGNRKHEGTDLMDLNNQPGYFPVLSMTEGVVENLGWLEMGGNRIGIRTKDGAYYYYAHLHSYEDSLAVGDRVIAGQLIGFMGDSGYGIEGTTGKFDVHLHLGIYLPTEEGDISINPYWLLQILEKDRISNGNGF